jgi:hypothetical protein
MATEILAANASPPYSNGFAIAAGESVTLLLRRDLNSGEVCVAYIEAQDSAGQWIEIGQLSERENIRVLQAVGTFRVRRADGAFAVDTL